jgi:hypothetical protein
MSQREITVVELSSRRTANQQTFHRHCRFRRPQSATTTTQLAFYRHRSLLGNDPATSVAGFVPAYERLAEFLGNEEDMPPIENFFGEEVIAGGPGPNDDAVKKAARVSLRPAAAKGDFTVSNNGPSLTLYKKNG